MPRFLKQYFLVLVCFSSLAQVQFEQNPPENIKTVIFKGPTEDQFPIIQLGETVYLEFDDLSATEQDYFYRIIHCDHDWTPSQLLKPQYLNGTDNVRIINYENSYNTLQPYSNYQLRIPNQNTSLRVSGNYVLEIYDSYDDLVFSRRFVVYKNVVGVGAVVKRARDFDFLNQKQSVQFTINAGDFQWVNPKQEIKVVILQNYQWLGALYDVKPQYAVGRQLVYRYDQETSFYGGNEFLNFDTSDLRAPTAAISKIEFKDLYHHYLFSDRFRIRDPYTYYPDINGDFVLRTLQGRETSREAEYTMVHFSLPYEPELGLNDVYVYGKFNNFALEEINKMNYNAETGMMEAVIPFKQGFYNYKYIQPSETFPLGANGISGDFHFTENTYTILVYYRDFGELFDSIIGIGTANSRDITN